MLIVSSKSISIGQRLLFLTESSFKASVCDATRGVSAAEQISAIASFSVRASSDDLFYHLHSALLPPPYTAGVISDEEGFCLIVATASNFDRLLTCLMRFPILNNCDRVRDHFASAIFHAATARAHHTMLKGLRNLRDRCLATTAFDSTHASEENQSIGFAVREFILANPSCEAVVSFPAL